VATAKARAVLRATLFLAVTGGLLALYPLVIALGRRARWLARRAWCRSVCRILNIRPRASGTPFSACPTLLVANHVSYVDILVLGSFTDATFIAKSEVEGWPLFGFIARLAGTLFIKRHWRQALIQRNAIAARMRENESFVLFAEGTSTNGLAVKPFKTSLLSVAEPWVMDRPVAVQGVTLAYTRLADGTPVSLANCDLYAWYADMPFTPHLTEMLRLPGLEVDLEFHEPVLSWSVPSRKPLGRALRAQIAERLAALRGGATLATGPSERAVAAVEVASTAAAAQH
jgi:1-acyl-sn-glycerol-3-phosphate acyltransferase